MNDTTTPSAPDISFVVQGYAAAFGEIGLSAERLPELGRVTQLLVTAVRSRARSIAFGDDPYSYYEALSELGRPRDRIES
jgi:hypothetical protein